MKATRHQRATRLPIACALLALGSPLAHAACTAGQYTDTVDGVALAYRIPAAFNGTLVVYAEGYADSTQTGPYQQTPYFLGDAALAQALIDAGYMLAGANYSLPDPTACTGGNYCQQRWAVPLGVTSSAAVPARIAAVQPDCAIERTLVAGADMGGLVALQIAESPTRAAAFDGALAMCTPGMGVSRWVDGLIDHTIFREAVDITDLPRVEIPNSVPWPLDWMVDGIRPRVQNEVQTSSFYLRLEFQRLGAGLDNPGNSYYLAPGNGVYSTVQLATTLVADLGDQLGAPFGPLEILTGESPGYSLGAGANNILEQLSASQPARDALHALGEVTGDLKIPALMLHAKSDAATPDWSLTHYRDAVAASARSARFHGVFANTSGRHCGFGTAQVLAALDALDDWAATGVAPTDARFPAPGFDVFHFPSPDPRRRVNVWLGGIEVTPGAGVQQVRASVVRSDTGPAQTLAYATSGGHTSAGTLDFPSGGDYRATLVFDVPDGRQQAVSLQLRQMTGPANVITPVSVLLPIPDGILQDGFE
jgi:hypothetical protein